MTIRVAVLGAAGRMGSVVCEAVERDPELELAARVDPHGGEGFAASVADMGEVDVAIDFTRPDAVMGNVRACLERGIHCVVGTTGLSPADLDELRHLASSSQRNVFVAPNFSIGAVLMMHVAALVARYFGSAEIVELHHNQKLDAPSGTAAATARLIAASWREHGRPPGGQAHPEERETAAGARGADVEGVHVHAVRLLGLVAHQEVLFGGPGETLCIRHDTLDRASFVPGVLLATKRVASLDGLVVGLDRLLGLKS